MKAFLFILFLHAFNAFSQEIDSIYLTFEKLADTVYGGLNQKAPTGLLFNRLFIPQDSSLANNTENYFSESSTLISNADYMYNLIHELRIMDMNKNKIASESEVYDSVSKFVATHEFEKQIFIYPVGIIDFEYNIVDEAEGVNNNILTVENSIFEDIDPDNLSIVSKKRAALVSPLFDYFDSEIIGLVFRKQDFLSNYKTLDNVTSIELKYKDVWHTMDWDTLYGFFPEDSVTLFNAKITFEDNTELLTRFSIHSPNIVSKSSIPSHPEFLFELLEYLDWIDHSDGCGWNYWSPGCKDCGSINDSGNEIQWCYIPSCLQENLTNPKPNKPYILVAGWRPPVFGQSFKKTWKVYDSDHGHLLSDLRRNNFDIILVRFNIHVKPQSHGMSESADLLAKFLTYLNDDWKTNDEHENIIQGSSMGADITRLTLLRMEKKHLADNSYSHHHTRLYISHDGNFYGANIPFAYQCQIYSEQLNPSLPGGTVPFGGLLKQMLFATEEQKTFKELVMYHPIESITHLQWMNPYLFASFQPNFHSKRQVFYDRLLEVDNGVHIFPMPIATRNISISLGKISGRNSDGAGSKFNNAGDYWHNYSLGLYSAKLGAAKHMSTGQYYNIYRRELVGLSLNPFFPIVSHNVMVTQMQEVDDCAGSYLNGLGNIIDVGDFTYFPTAQVINGKNLFNHKSVLTALGINKNLWPSNGSHILDMKTLNLMYNNYSDLSTFTQSNNFGYPHLGRPADHFQVTPFEAIYVDNKPDPHIQLSESDQGDVAILNNFIKNETEPWELALQNQNVGSHARSNYIYKVHRRARVSIVAGYHVTPMTNDGDYVAESNAEINLRAGQSITLKPGVHFKAGSVEHLKIEFVTCGD